jgi:ubiquitin-conjugating enzyme E2 Z
MVLSKLWLLQLTWVSTWRGERGEEWSSAQGLESILLSIQSLLSSNPYENEPGFEDANEESDKKAQNDYVQKVCPHTRLYEYTSL